MTEGEWEKRERDRTCEDERGSERLGGGVGGGGSNEGQGEGEKVTEAVLGL